MSARHLVIALLLACGGRPPTMPRNEATAGIDVMLYRDLAVVRHRIEVEIPPVGISTARVHVARGVRGNDLFILDDGGLAIHQVRFVGDPLDEQELETPSEDDEDEGDSGDSEDSDDSDDSDEKPDNAKTVVTPQPIVPREIEIVVGGRPGRAAFALAYVTPDLKWEAAYTLVTTRDRDRATLRGALAVHNTTGVALPGVQLRIADADLGAAAARNARQLATALGGGNTPTATTAVRDLGHVDLADGDTRAELLRETRPRPMHSALSYDPVGTKLDRKGAAPDRDPTLGANQSSSRVTETYEIVRDPTVKDLPGGPVRLFERRPDGSIALLAESRMFDVTTRYATADVITVGTAEGITGHRERREITIDELGNVSEDFVLTIENSRNRPIDIVLREHLYRGLEWTVRYYTAPTVEKEGPQQFAMRTRAPARGKVTVLYVVVYKTPDP